MADLPYVEAITQNATGWLRGKWAQKFLFAFGISLDQVLEGAKQAVFQALPFKADATALYRIGENASLEAAHNSGLTESQYRTTLSQPHIIHRKDGGRDGVLMALARAGYPSAYVYEQRTQYDATHTPEAIDVHGHKEIGWGRFTQQSDWNQFWVVLEVPLAADWTDAESWTDSVLWPANIPLGSFPFVDHAVASSWIDSQEWLDAEEWFDPIPHEEIARVFRIVRKFKAKESRFMGVYWIFPGGAVQGHPLPAPSGIWNDFEAWNDSEAWIDGFTGNGLILSPPVVFWPAA